MSVECGLAACRQRLLFDDGLCRWHSSDPRAVAARERGRERKKNDPVHPGHQESAPTEAWIRTWTPLTQWYVWQVMGVVALGHDQPT